MDGCELLGASLPRNEVGAPVRSDVTVPEPSPFSYSRGSVLSYKVARFLF